MKLSNRTLQAALTVCLVALVASAFVPADASYRSAIQISVSLAVIAASFLGAQLAGQKADEAKASRENFDAYPAPKPNETNGDLVPPLETKSAPRFLVGGYIVDELYAHPARIVPVFQSGTHYTCDAEPEDNYSISIGNVHVEVCEGEAKLTIKSTDVPERTAPFEKRPLRPMKLM